jgi:hypothetical protein
MNDLDPTLAAALDELVPPFEGIPSQWRDVLRRGGVGRGRSRRSRLLIAGASAAVLLGALAATSFGQAVLGSTLDRLGAWTGVAPGEPASTAQQEAFDAANEESYAHFPPGTQVGRLLTTTFEGETYELLGFRDGGSLCLRLAGPQSEGRPPASCAPQRQLSALGEPAAVLTAGDVFSRGGEASATALYGVAADDVDGVLVETADGERHPAALRNNAFIYLAPGNRSFAGRAGADAPVRAIVHEGGQTLSVAIETGPAIDRPEPGDLPGPATVERTLGPSHIGWLERGEARGAPYDWPGAAPETVVTSRLVHPNPDSSFEMGVAFGRDGGGQEAVGWYCLSWLWPLVKGSGSYGCARETVTGLLPMYGSGQGADQFPLFAGLAADDVASLELFFPNGAHEQVPLVDNVYAFQAPRALHTKLVAYDAEHRVVGIYML